MKLSIATAHNVDSTTSSVVPLVIEYSVHVVDFIFSTALHLTKAADFRSGGFTSQSHLGPRALQWRQSHSAWMVCIAGGEVCLPSSFIVTLMVLMFMCIQQLSPKVETALLQQCPLPICTNDAHKFCMCLHQRVSSQSVDIFAQHSLHRHCFTPIKVNLIEIT